MSVGQVIRDLKAAIAEVGKSQLQLSVAVIIPRTRTRISVFIAILEAIGTKSALSSAFMSEVSTVDLQMLFQETFGE